MIDSIPSLPESGEWAKEAEREAAHLKELAAVITESTSGGSGEASSQQQASHTIETQAALGPSRGSASITVAVAGVNLGASAAVGQRLVAGLAPYGIQVLPLAEAPAGEADPWFAGCLRAEFCLALLNHDFLTSERCEDQLTYAKDTRTRTIALVIDKEGLAGGMGDAKGRVPQEEGSNEFTKARVRELEAEVARLQRKLGSAQA